MCIRAALCVKPHEPKRQKDPIPCEKVDLVEGTPLAKAGELGDLGMQRTAGGYREQQGSIGDSRGAQGQVG